MRQAGIGFPRRAHRNAMLQAPFTGRDLFGRAIRFLAIECARGIVVRDLLSNLGFEPSPNSVDRH